MAQAADLDDRGLVEALCAGDETAFASLLDRYHGALVEVALRDLGDRTTADEVVRRAWLRVIDEIDELGRTDGLTVREWLVRLVRAEVRRSGHGTLAGQARTGDGAGPAVDPARFVDLPRWDGEWAVRPKSWHRTATSRLDAPETLASVRAAIDALGSDERSVYVLRDVEGRDPAEVSALLRVSARAQRMLLHQARAKVWRALEIYFDAST